MYSYDFYREDETTYCLYVSNDIKSVIFRIKDGGSLYVQLGYGGDTQIIDTSISQFLEDLREKDKKEKEDMFNSRCDTFLNSFVIINKHVVK